MRRCSPSPQLSRGCAPHLCSIASARKNTRGREREMWVALELHRRGGGHRPGKEAVEQGGTDAIVAAPTGLRRPCRSCPRPPTLPPSPRHSRRPPPAGEGGAGTIVVVPTGLCRPRRSHLHPHAAHVILRRPCRSCRHRLHPRTALGGEKRGGRRGI